MKRYMKWGLGVVVLTLVGMVGVSHVTNAQQFSTDVDAGKVVNSSLYSTGQTISIKGEIHGDIFCAGRTVDIDATVHGDIICAGQDVTIAGKVDGDIRVAGQHVSIAATVGDNVTVVADELSIDAPAVIGRDLTALGTTLNSKGSVGRDALLNGTNGIINGTVKRNATYEGTKLELKSGARIGGSLTYTSKQEAKKSDGADVAGTTEHKQPQKGGGWFDFNLSWYVLALTALTAVSMVIALVAPRTLQNLSDSIGAAWIKPLFIGFAASIVLPFLMVGLIVTIVGIPLGGLLLISWIALMMLSGPVVAYYLGSRIWGQQKNVLVRTLVGSVVLVTLYFVPFLGFLILLATYWTGAGAILLAAKQRLGKPDYIVK